MLYSMFDWLRDLDVPGARLMDYITFRSGVAFVLALFIATVFGRRIIDRLQRMQIGEVVRDLGLQGQLEKKGTPTMGGVIIILAILVPCLLVGNLANVYMQLMIVATLWLGTLGFLDDYLKLKRHNKDGMKGKFKIVGQVGLGLLVGLTVWLSPRITMVPQTSETYVTEAAAAVSGDDETSADANANASSAAIKTPQTTIPFVKNNNFDYQSLTEWMGDFAPTGGWIAFVLVTIFVVAATSNGANLTDGLDGLATGVSAPVVAVLGVLAYLSGHIVYADYLNIMYIPGSGELVVFAAAFIGALIGFLWYNTHPAQIFMGDTGSLSIGGIMAVFALCIRKELLLPLLCGVFLVENLSTMLQTGYFKYSKRKYGEGRRLFRMAPIHHHFQKMGLPETKIVIRFWIVSLLLAAITLVTLKIR